MLGRIVRHSARRGIEKKNHKTSMFSFKPTYRRGSEAAGGGNGLAREGGGW